MDTSLWRMLEVATVIWGSYALISGLVLLLLRIRSSFKRKVENLSCCSMFLAFFSNLDQALNPLGLSRLEMKLQFHEIQSRVELLSQQQVLLSQNFQLVAQRLGNIEDDLAKLRVMFDQHTTVRAKIQLLKTLTSAPQTELEPLLAQL